MEDSICADGQKPDDGKRRELSASPRTGICQRLACSRSHALAAPLILMSLSLAGTPRAWAFELGPVQINPSVGVHGVYEDNVLQGSGEDCGEPILDDVALRIRPTLDLGYQEAPLVCSLNYYT